MELVVQQKELLSPLGQEPHAFAKFVIDAKKYPASIIEEIAIGQTLGAWEEQFVDKKILTAKVAKIIAYERNDSCHIVTLAFPLNIWHGKLSWLLAILFGKMSFYESVQLNSVWFSKDCFTENYLAGPKWNMELLRKKVGVTNKLPLLMGILKPNVAMADSKICDLYLEAAQAGLHILKDDEIRHDKNFTETIKRVELIAETATKRNLNTLYAVHMPIDCINFKTQIKNLENAGAQALLINTWSSGIDFLQEIRKLTTLPILSHPAMVGAFGIQAHSSTIHPRVTLAQFIRAAGADLSLFPSPYGKLGLTKEIALDIAQNCNQINENWSVNPLIPVPSAGIKPEHAPLAKKDFGKDFVLNAGTGIFANSNGISTSIQQFKKELEQNETIS